MRLIVNRVILVALLFAMSIVSGCTTVPVSVERANIENANSIHSDKDKYPLNIGLLINDSFRKFTLRKNTTHMNIGYKFKYELGSDFSYTLPEFFKNRFEKVDVIDNLNESSQYDYIFIPKENIKSSRLLEYSGVATITSVRISF